MADSSTAASAADTAPAVQAAWLVIGYGNELRGDDGAGPRVAEAIDALRLPGVEVIACHQLTPDLADPISRAARVIFADAQAFPGPFPAPMPSVEILDLQAATHAHLNPHGSDPAALLALTQALYGRCPPATCMAIPAVSFEFGFQLSPVARQGVREAVEHIRSRIIIPAEPDRVR